MFINKVLLKKAFNVTLEEYFQKTTLNGFGLLYYIRRRKYQRVFWFISIVFGCSFAVYVSFINVKTFMDNPTVITLEPFKHPIYRKSIPAIAVCSANKISRSRAEVFAGEFTKRTDKPLEYWLEKLILLSGYYDDNIVDLDEAMAFELELQKRFGENYDIAGLLKSLAPPCEEILVECHILGKQRNCSELFKTVPTIIGHCCIFNRREEHIVKNFSATHLIMTGAKNGLDLILNASIADYFYKGRSMNGFQLQIFENHNLPDVTTGGVQEIMISPGTDTTVELSMVFQAAESSVRRFSYLRRRCFFEDESLGEEELGTSQPECLSRCRVDKCLDTCYCVPYYTPKEYYKGMDNVSFCSLMHLECLGAFFVTWRTYRPKELEFADYIIPDGIKCEHCYPLCSFNYYYYQKQSNKLEKTLYLRRNRKYLKKLKNNTGDLSIVRIFFKDRYATQFNKKVLYNWFQILSNIGGVLGISIGCSIISGFEILYFFVYRFSENFLNLRKMKNKA